MKQSFIDSLIFNQIDFARKQCADVGYEVIVSKDFVIVALAISNTMILIVEHDIVVDAVLGDPTELISEITLEKLSKPTCGQCANYNNILESQFAYVPDGPMDGPHFLRIKAGLSGKCSEKCHLCQAETIMGMYLK